MRFEQLGTHTHQSPCPSSYINIPTMQVEMAKSSNQAKAPKQAKKNNKKDSPLRKAWEKTEKMEKKKEGPKGCEPSRAEHSLFLTYLKSAMKGKDARVASQATSLNNYYNKLTAPEKKGIIVAFFKQGGKRQGLSSVFSQFVECENLARDGKWSGYANFRKVLNLKDVPIVT